MKQIPLFSLVIFPSPEQIELVKSYKQLLKSHIGWFGSVNSKAHITVIQFDNEMLLTLYIDQVREFCKTIVPQNVTLNTWNHFVNPHTFFIGPDKPSQLYLDKLIIDLHEHLGFKVSNTNSHMSIARKLDPEKIRIAYELFSNTEINFEFNCDAFYLRKFNDQTKQYSDIIEKISFGK
ncbi:2'-5' RNA ligase family protein [Flavobacterium sp.]|uniref:2'-5' RNA ligase family protein n=1 Tax=Flavobacterium sp. TaxID=239 RepID=UPI003918DF0F